MRAVLADRPGAPGVLHPVTLPDPEPGPGQVRVAVQAAAVTFVDTLVRAGSPIAPPATFPVVLGNGVGGLVDLVGPEVDPAWVGTRVVTATGGTGGYASLALARLGDLHRIPAPVGLREATALLADGRTAVGLHRAAGIRPGETVVVTAAAGGVGGLLVQLAGSSGAHVVALAGNADKLEHARGLGAHTTVDHRAPDWPTRWQTAVPDGVDVVFDGVGAGTTAVLSARVRTGGRYVQHGAAGGSWGTVDPGVLARGDVELIGLSSIGATPDVLFELVEHALGLASLGSLQPTIGQTTPLADAADAHRAIESRTTIGKTLLLP